MKVILKHIMKYILDMYYKIFRFILKFKFEFVSFINCIVKYMTYGTSSQCNFYHFLNFFLKNYFHVSTYFLTIIDLNCCLLISEFI
jgi:hypothetical protein